MNDVTLFINCVILSTSDAVTFALWQYSHQINFSTMKIPEFQQNAVNKIKEKGIIAGVGKLSKSVIMILMILIIQCIWITTLKRKY